MLGEVVVQVETFIQAGREGLAVEHNRTDECRGLIATILEQPRAGWINRGKPSAEGCYAVRAGEQTRKNADVRRRSYWAWRENPRESHAVASQAVERGSLDLRVAETVNVIGAQRVDSD